jgi:hypothetical protein
MTLKKIIGTGAIAGALGFSAIGLASVANAAPTPQAAPSAVQHAQLTGWGDHGRGGGHGWGGGRGWGGPGWRGPGQGGPGFAGWGGPPLPPPCPLGLCI